MAVNMSEARRLFMAVVVKVSHVRRGMVGQSSYTFWVAVCVAIVMYSENFKFRPQ